MRTHRDKARRKYAAIEKGAAMRGIEFDITFLEYKGAYFEKPCHYCGIIAIGLDRICSADGYNTANVVTCCTICNMMKGVLERDAFLTHCKRIALLHETEMPMHPVQPVKHVLDERSRILAALQATGYNRAKAAKLLNISTTTLWRHITAHGIKIEHKIA